MKLILSLLIITIISTVCNAEIHAVLAAGSKGYSNYRH